MTPIGLVCKKCGGVFGVIFTPIQPKTTPLVAACSKCVAAVLNGKPATNDAESAEVEKKL